MDNSRNPESVYPASFSLPETRSGAKVQPGIRVARDFWKSAIAAVKQEKESSSQASSIEKLVVVNDEDDDDNNDIDVVEWLAWAWAPLLNDDAAFENRGKSASLSNDKAAADASRSTAMSRFASLPADFGYIMQDLMPFMTSSAEDDTKDATDDSSTTRRPTDEVPVLQRLLAQLEKESQSKVHDLLHDTQEKFANLRVSTRPSPNTMSSSLLSSLRDELSSDNQNDAWKYGSDSVLDRTLMKITIYQAKTAMDYQASLSKCMEYGSIICTVGDILRQPGGVLRKKCVFLFGKDSRADAHEIGRASCRERV